MHWIAVPGQRAQDVIQFWNTRQGTYGSAHAVVDLDGTIYQTLPWDEVGYHVGSSRGYTRLAKDVFGAYTVTSSSPNWECLGIEMCHPGANGEYNKQAWDAGVELAAHLCRTYNLNPHKELLTHQMVVGWKNCPKWFVDNPDEFEFFRRQVDDHI